MSTIHVFECRKCEGTGKLIIQNKYRINCTSCNGSGKIIASSHSSK